LTYSKYQLYSGMDTLKSLTNTNNWKIQKRSHEHIVYHRYYKTLSSLRGIGHHREGESLPLA